MMKLYSGDLSPYSAKVRMQIYAKGITDITLERPAGFGTQDWWKTSPIGRIPALELPGGDIIPESEVIAEYLDIPPEFTIILSEGRPRQCRLAWRIGCELGAQFVD